MWILFLLLDIWILYFLFKEINRRHYLGELIMKVGLSINDYLFIILWSILGLLFTADLILPEYYYNKEIMLDEKLRNSLMLLLSITSIIRFGKSKEIREKGISTTSGLITFKKIKEITWLEEDRVEFIFEGPLFNVKQKWQVKEEEAEKVKEILEQYYV